MNLFDTPNEYNIGDEVIILEDYGPARQGMLGVIASLSGGQVMPGVDIGTGLNDIRTHTLDGALTRDTGYYVPNSLMSPSMVGSADEEL